MSKEIFDKAVEEIEDFRDKLGEVVVDCFMEDGNNCKEIGTGVKSCFASCKTEQEFKIANDMLMSLCGYSIETIIGKIRQNDAEGYCWESL